MADAIDKKENRFVIWGDDLDEERSPHHLVISKMFT